MTSPTRFQANPDRKPLLQERKASSKNAVFLSSWEQLQHAVLPNQKVSHISKQRIFSDYLALNVIQISFFTFFFFFFNSVTDSSGSNSLFLKLSKMSNWNILYPATSTFAKMTVEEEIFCAWCLPQAQVLGAFSKNESAISQNLEKEKIFCSYLNSRTRSRTKPAIVFSENILVSLWFEAGT